MVKPIANWLETNWVSPAYGGGLLAVLAICFFGVATNTMAGWLYVLSGVGLALLGIAAVLPSKSLQPLIVKRLPIQPVTAGAELAITIAIDNPTAQIRSLFQVHDLAPFHPLHPPSVSIEAIQPNSQHLWVYHQPTEQRGVYQWEQVVLRSGAPIGLFWCRRYRLAPAVAYVYPQVLNLAHCPILDEIGNIDRRDRQPANQQLESANEGMTRSLRAYRYGDPFRSIHWRTSARYGEFQVRELEIDRGGQDVIIYLDSGASWNATDFEQAVIAACSLYFYANRLPQLSVKLWTARTGLISGDRQVLETLAAVQMDEPATAQPPPTAVVCLTSQLPLVGQLPRGSRWLLWASSRLPTGTSSGLIIDAQKSLQQQLNSANFTSGTTPAAIHSPSTHLN